MDRVVVSPDLSIFSGLRIGSGFDIHPLSSDPKRRFILGGIEVCDSNGPLGHSDADVVCHALSDAILGSAALGGLGDHFKDTDERWRDKDSIEMLVFCHQMFVKAGHRLINADVTVVLQEPRISTFLSLISSNMSRVLGAQVSVKAKSAEKIGSLGSGQAVVCFATTLGYKTS